MQGVTFSTATFVYFTSASDNEDITEYIEIFYKRQRRQSKLGYLSPAACARKYYAGLVAA